MILFGSFSCVTAPQVLVDQQSVEVVGFTSGVVNFTMPASVDGQSSVPVQVACNGQQSAPISIPIMPVAPGIFTASMTGTGQGAVLNADLSVNSALNPAARSTPIAIYATGFGTYQSPSSDGLQRLTHDVQAFVGDMPAGIQFEGHAPSLSLGAQQINILIPANSPTGPNVPIRLVVDGVSTQTGVTIAIQSGAGSGTP
jgi:uncharacterized protein (TIGR03437 family)